MSDFSDVGALGFDSAPDGNTFATGTEGMRLPKGWGVGMPWGFAVLTDVLVRVIIPPSGRPACTTTAMPAWIAGVMAEEWFGADYSFGHVECASGTRLLVINENNRIMISDTLTDATTPWAKAIDMPMPDVDVPARDYVDEDVPEPPLISAEITRAVVEAIRAIGDDVLYAPYLYAWRNPGSPVDLDVYDAGRVMVDGDILYFPDKNNVYEYDEVEEGEVQVDTELITWRVDMTGGVIGAVDSQIISSLGMFGEVRVRGYRRATAFDPNAGPPLFWSGFRLATETA